MNNIRKIKKLLIANRGEIALRVQNACLGLGIEPVIIASEVDKTAYFARKAKNLYVIGAGPAKESYLSIEKIVKAALDLKCDAVHPGYGFLSENADFAQAVVDAGLIFVGPSPESIRILGSKTLARHAAIKNGVPCLAGSDGKLKDAEILEYAKKIGFPVIIKAVAGGGGRGMRIANNTQELTDSLPRARAEALKFFSSDEVFIEKYILNPKHVEVQLMGDQHGNVLHFGTRDCSSQRRHQKLIEEAPAPFLSETTREKIHQAAVAAAKSVGYYNAGTAEFIVSKNGDKEEFFFLEMNTRIQVEHPVSEAICNFDLVQAQLKVAQGEKLNLKQSDIKFHGHAIEFRIYAEDPNTNFSPATGRIGKIERVKAPYLREDYGFEEGDVISPYYDAMLSKIIVWGPSRQTAINRSINVLRQYKVHDLPTTLGFHKWMLYNQDFNTTGVDVKYIDREFKAEFLDQIESTQKIASDHQLQNNQIYKIEKISARSEKTNKIYNIDLVHYNAGSFIATTSTQEFKLELSRASNTKEKAVSSLIEEVLEKS